MSVVTPVALVLSGVAAHQSHLTDVRVFKELCEATAPVQSMCVIMTFCVVAVYIPLKHTRSTSKTHLNGMTGP